MDIKRIGQGIEAYVSNEVEMISGQSHSVVQRTNVDMLIMVIQNKQDVMERICIRMLFVMFEKHEKNIAMHPARWTGSTRWLYWSISYEILLIPDSEKGVLHSTQRQE